MLGTKLRKIWRHRQLPKAARVQGHLDRKGPGIDPGVETAIQLSVGWLARAQDCSTTQDGGVSWGYSLLRGWYPSYPETTGYIIPTLLDYSRRTNDSVSKGRVRKMLDWLVSIQFEDGGFQGGYVGQTPRAPVVFNTGQILLGLAAGVAEFGSSYRDALRRAGDWLVSNQEKDGRWTRFASPFTETGAKAYDAHVAWALIEADRVDPGRGYAEAASANARWAISRQAPNGWFADCCVSDPERPITHTLGYVLRGLIEVYSHTNDEEILEASQRLAKGLFSQVDGEGRLAGRFDCTWQPAADWSCLTGNAQIACCGFRIASLVGDHSYLESSARLNSFVRRTINVNGGHDVRGAVRGSFPISGDYIRYGYPNWACKFFVDANALELMSMKSESSRLADAK